MLIARSFRLSHAAACAFSYRTQSRGEESDPTHLGSTSTIKIIKFEIHLQDKEELEVARQQKQQASKLPQPASALDSPPDPHTAPRGRSVAARIGLQQ